jgi:hypothetical protein
LFLKGIKSLREASPPHLAFDFLRKDILL